MADLKLSATQQRKVEVILKRWEGKIGWARIEDRVEVELGFRISRQSLSKYPAIYDAYLKRRDELRGVTPEIRKEVTKSDVQLNEQVKKLQSENVILVKKNDKQLRMIERILANANEIPNVDLRSLVQIRPEEV